MSYLLAGIERDKTSATSPEHTVRMRSLMIDVFPHPFSPTSITGLPYSVSTPIRKDNCCKG